MLTSRSVAQFDYRNFSRRDGYNIGEEFVAPQHLGQFLHNVDEIQSLNMNELDSVNDTEVETR